MSCAYPAAGANAVASRDIVAPAVNIWRIFMYQSGMRPRRCACLSTDQDKVKPMASASKLTRISSKMMAAQLIRAGITDQTYQVGERSSRMARPQWIAPMKLRMTAA